MTRTREHVRDTPQKPLPRPPHEHHAVLLGELVQRRLQHGDVAPGLGVEALEQRGLGLVQTREFFLLETVPQRRLGDELLVDIVETQALGQLLADLRAARADFVGEGHDRHGRHSFLYLAQCTAGAMALRLPLTSSRT
jgi:hypothetical protein